MPKKAIVIGLDGLEPSIVEAMLGRGELPNLERIRKSGFYSRLRTTYPAQTPVAWSSFATGSNPGGHGIFDFIARDPATYLPDAALSLFEKPKNIFSPPQVVNNRHGVPLWQVLSKAGVPSVVLRCPCTFPPDEINGRMLAGVGVPDLRGSQSKGTFYTQDSTVRAQESEQVVVLGRGSDLKTQVIGPRNTRQAPGGDTTCEIRIHSNKKFYVSAVNFDPSAPMFPVASPGPYAKDLADQIGLFSTLGMAEEHNGLHNGRFDEAAFLAQCELVLGERERLMRFELDRFKEGFLFLLYDTPDRVQHMLWRFRDPLHPGYEADLARDYGSLIDQHYVRCDKLLGPALDRVDHDTLLIVLSDHGFNTFRRAFDTNTWLWQNGLLALKNGRQASEDSGEGFAQVDWSKTHAYAVGLGGIYLNLKGREREGIVQEGSEAERFRIAIQSGLAGIADAKTQKPAIRNVMRKEELYSGPYAEKAPDLLVNFCPGFRVSWQSAVGGFANSLIEDNMRRWSGDHIVDPDTVPGILFMNHNPHSVSLKSGDPRVRQGQLSPPTAVVPPGLRSFGQVRNVPSIVDLAPTILNYLGVTVPDTMEGTSLL